MWDKEYKLFRKFDNVKYLWCKSKYPTVKWDLKNFPSKFSESGFYGISDHCIGYEVALIIIARDANVVEKNFTLDKSDTTIRDHALSLLPDEFKKLVELGSEMHKIVNNFQE